MKLYRFIKQSALQLIKMEKSVEANKDNSIDTSKQSFTSHIQSTYADHNQSMTDES